MDANSWVVFGIFAALWVATVIVTIVLTVRRRKNNFIFWTLIIGGLMRCVTMLPMGTYGEIASDIAGLLFFSSCCITLTQVVRNFHEKRNNKNGIYYSMMFVLIGYNVLFYILELCIAGLTIYLLSVSSSKDNMNGEAEDDGSQSASLYARITKFILCILFGVSFLVLAITYLIVFAVLRNSWAYLKKIIVPYFILFACMILRGILNISTAFLGDNTPDFLSVNTVNNYSSLVIEGIPVIMLLIITIFNVSPWEGPYIPLNNGDGVIISETSELITARDIFRDSAINVISIEELIRGETTENCGIATVFRATYRGNSVSMKVYNEAVREMTPTQTSYLTREMKLMSGLRHPNIVGLYGVTLTDEGKLGIVAELAELGSLRALLPHMHRDMHWVLILRMAQDIATGMSFLHKHNVLHRNLNSSNVLVTKVLQCKVSDMGFACLSPFETTGKLSTGAVEYMAPEVLSKHGYSPKSDVYSFGAVLAELATGVPPYSDLGLTPEEICRGVTGGRLHVLSAKGGPSSCLRPIADLISQCTNGSPDSRPDFEEVKVRIECIKNSLGSLQNSY